MEIEVNDYVRIKNGAIRKIIKINEGKEKTIFGKYRLDKPYNNCFSVAQNKIVKHSKNIIDILEIGDILRVFDNLSEIEEKVNIFDDEMLKAVKEDIKDNNYEILSILTHEQFSSLEYII